MIENIKNLLQIRTEKDEVGKDGEKYDYVIDAKEVAEAQNKSLNAVYTSRKGECKLDKLTAFDKIKKLIEANEKGQFALNGDKDGVLNGLSDVLKDNTKYEINFKEV